MPRRSSGIRRFTFARPFVKKPASLVTQAQPIFIKVVQSDTQFEPRLIKTLLEMLIWKQFYYIPRSKEDHLRLTKPFVDLLSLIYFRKLKRVAPWWEWKRLSQTYVFFFSMKKFQTLNESWAFFKCIFEMWRQLEEGFNKHFSFQFPVNILSKYQIVWVFLNISPASSRLPSEKEATNKGCSFQKNTVYF